MFLNWAQPIRLQRHWFTPRFLFGFVSISRLHSYRNMPNVPIVSRFITFPSILMQFPPVWPPQFLPLLVASWKPQGSCVPACATIVRFLIIIPCCRPAPYDVWECGRCGTESQPEPVFNDGLLQPEQRMPDPRERTGARSAPSLQHVHKKPALERLQSL